MQTNELLIAQTRELEALADMMIDKATKLKADCRKQREKLAGVSTLAIKKKIRETGLTEKEGLEIQLRRQRYIDKRKNLVLSAPGH